MFAIKSVFLHYVNIANTELVKTVRQPLQTTAAWFLPGPVWLPGAPVTVGRTRTTGIKRSSWQKMVSLF